ncbi:MAG: hypothetical protein AUK48_02395 [Oscillatoriales cyanobacterium CG2_30_44_21]|nr:MAG: hypothetical protein AUK48_02395 [Oscillatoriales cyanobacterium CG2_30_44_21]
MNISQVPDSQLIAMWFACLAWANNPLPIEQKNSILEKALMAKILDSNQPLTIVQGGFIEFDNALIDYAQALEQRVRALQVSTISTGSELLDSAFKDRIQTLIDINFPPVVEGV